MTAPATLLPQRLARVARDHRDRTALSAEGETVSYGDLSSRAARLATALAGTDAGSPAVVAVVGSRSVWALVSAYACHHAGRACLPLWSRAPGPYNAGILRRSGATVLVADTTGRAALEAILSANGTPLTVICPDARDGEVLRQSWPRHRFVDAHDLSRATAAPPAAPAAEDAAYVIHTSGSTGEPKGVVLTHGGLATLLDTLEERYRPTPDDRFSQFADLTFDFSIAETLIPWTSGATLCCPSQRTLLNPSTYLRENHVTFFHGMPSHSALLLRLGALGPGRFPELRAVILAGESLPCAVAEAWSNAAPGATLDNLYGPTECTVYSTVHRWDASRSSAESENGIVAIGRPLPGFAVTVVDERENPVPPGQPGELCLSGPQVSPGYLNDVERTQAAFGPLPGLPGRWYRTGDRVRLPAAADGPLLFLGRQDHQVKIGGIRIELGEVEAQLRQAAGSQEVACVGWPVTDNGVGGLVAFVCAEELDGKALREELRKRLPPYLVPGEVRVMPEFPHTRSGKLDRQALAALLERERP